jgi:hypothetical protein
MIRSSLVISSSHLGLLFALALAAQGCGGSSSDEPGAGSNVGNSGVITDEWRGYCVATFSQDYAVLDFFDERLFTARAGEEYLMASYGTQSDEDHASLLYLTPDGPYDFSITAPAGSREFPFTTNCEFDNATRYYAVFEDVTVYETEALSTPICELSAGTVLAADTSQMAGHSAVTVGLSGPQTYDVFLNVFASQCGGAESGYVSVPETVVLGIHTWLVPIRSIIGPS